MWGIDDDHSRSGGHGEGYPGREVLMNRILIVGATGLAGAQAVRHFAALPGWAVTALSRRAPEAHAGVTHLPVDLTDSAACAKAFAM